MYLEATSTMAENTICLDNQALVLDALTFEECLHFKEYVCDTIQGLILLYFIDRPNRFAMKKP